MRGQSISYFLYIYLFILYIYIYIYIFILYIYYYSIQVNESQDQVVPNSDECQVESNNETLVHDEDEVSQKILQLLIVSISKCKKIDLVLIT